MVDVIDLIVPTDIANWTITVPLDGADYELSAQWLDRPQCWQISLADVDGIAIFSGRTLTCNKDLLRPHRYTGRTPPGVLMCFDPSASIDVPAMSDLLTGSVVLRYIPAESFR